MDKDRQRALAKRVGAAMAAQRRAAGVTQEGLAEKLDCGVAVVSRVERGTIMPTLPRLIDTAEALGCSYLPLLGVADELPSDQALSLTRQLATLNPRDRELLLAMLETLVRRLKT